MSKRVFISYSAQDRTLIPRVMDWLRASGLSPAQVEDPVNWGASSQDVRTVIRDSVRRADLLLLVWSKQAVESAWVQYEVGMAQALGKPVVVLLAGGSPTDLPRELADTQHEVLDATTP